MSGDHNMHQRPLHDVAVDELRRLQADNEAKDALLRQALLALTEGGWKLETLTIRTIKEHLNQ